MRTVLALLLLIGFSSCQNLSYKRFLATSTTTAGVKEFYGDNVTISYSGNLGCGSCVRGGYVFCYKGVEGEVVADTLPTSSQKCCKDSKAC